MSSSCFSGVRPRGGVSFRSNVRQRFFDRHVLLTGRVAASFVVVEQVVGFGDLDVVVHVEVLRARAASYGAEPCAGTSSRTVCLLIAFVLQPVEGDIGDNVGGIAGVFDRFAVANHRRVVVRPLASEDFVKVKSGRPGSQVPLTDHGGLISASLQQLRECLLRAVEGVAVLAEPIQVAVFARQNDGPARSANRVCTETVFEEHPPFAMRSRFGVLLIFDP